MNNFLGKYVENLNVAIAALLSNKFRAILTTIGIGIGISSVVILMSLGNAVQNYVNKQFLSIGSNLIFVQPAMIASGAGAPVGRAGGALSSLSDRDVALINDPFRVP